MEHKLKGILNTKWPINFNVCIKTVISKECTAEGENSAKRIVQSQEI